MREARIWAIKSAYDEVLDVARSTWSENREDLMNSKSNAALMKVLADRLFSTRANRE